MGSNKYGDTIRLLAGGRAASNQIEFMNMYGTSAPKQQQTKSVEEQVPVSHDKIIESENLRVQEEKQFQEEWNQLASDMMKSMTSDDQGELAKST